MLAPIKKNTYYALDNELGYARKWSFLKKTITLQAIVNIKIQTIQEQLLHGCGLSKVAEKYR